MIIHTPHLKNLLLYLILFSQICIVFEWKSIKNNRAVDNNNSDFWLSRIQGIRLLPLIYLDLYGHPLMSQLLWLGKQLHFLCFLRKKKDLSWQSPQWVRLGHFRNDRVPEFTSCLSLIVGVQIGRVETTGERQSFKNPDSMPWGLPWLISNCFWLMPDAQQAPSIHLLGSGWACWSDWGKRGVLICLRFILPNFRSWNIAGEKKWQWSLWTFSPATDQLWIFIG